MKKIRIVALILALCSLLSLTAWAEDAPAAEEPAEAETVEGPAWEIVSSGVKVWKDKAKIIAALAYLILPIDLLPDAIPVVGVIDDAAILWAVLRLLVVIDDSIKVQAAERVRQWS